MIPPTRERRDWTLLVFFIPIGIILMLVAGQFAIQLVPEWSMNAGMRSNLDPNSLPNQQSAPVQPISPAILTPLGWLDTFLTPGAGSEEQFLFPPFVVFEPSAVPEVTLPPPTAVTDTPATPATDLPTETLSPPTATSTPKTTATLHTVVPTATTIVPTATTVVPTVTTVVPTVTTVVPTATTVVPTATTVVPTATTVVPTATTVVPTVTTVVPTATTVVPTATTVVPTVTAVVPTATPVGTRVVTIPAQLNMGTPDDSIYNLQNGKFIVMDLGTSPIVVTGSSETNYYDMVFYERENPVHYISMDRVIVGVSTYPNGSIYYTVFNWGNITPDMNSNVGVVASSTHTETDNQHIATTYLYGVPATRTGIAIDVDNFLNGPPVGSYRYLVIQAPNSGRDGADIDSVQVVEVQILSAPASSEPSMPKPRTLQVNTELVLPVEETPTSLPEETSVLTVEEAPTLLPVEGVPTLQPEEAPSSP